MKRFLTLFAFIAAITSANAQMPLDMNLIEEIVKTERQYFNDITEVFRSDDPNIRVDDIALVYYGQAFLPGFSPVNNENEKLLNKYIEESNYPKIYETATEILKKNPASLNALYYAWISASTIGKSDDEYLTYVNKFQNILLMIKRYNDGKSAETAFRIVHPDDQLFIMQSLGIEDFSAPTLDTKTLCNIFKVTPSKKFQHRHMYFDLSIFLNSSK